MADNTIHLRAYTCDCKCGRVEFHIHEGRPQCLWCGCVYKAVAIEARPESLISGPWGQETVEKING